MGRCHIASITKAYFQAFQVKFESLEELFIGYLIVPGRGAFLSKVHNIPAFVHTYLSQARFIMIRLRTRWD